MGGDICSFYIIEPDIYLGCLHGFGIHSTVLQWFHFLDNFNWRREGEDLFVGHPMYGVIRFSYTSLAIYHLHHITSLGMSFIGLCFVSTYLGF